MVQCEWSYPPLLLGAQPDSNGVGGSLLASVTTLYLFCKVHPALLVRHTTTLQPYLSIKCTVSMSVRTHTHTRTRTHTHTHTHIHTWTCTSPYTCVLVCCCQLGGCAVPVAPPTTPTHAYRERMTSQLLCMSHASWRR